MPQNASNENTDNHLNKNVSDKENCDLVEAENEGSSSVDIQTEKPRGRKHMKDESNLKKI